MKTQQQAEREEQQRIKNLVLNYDLRESEEFDGDSHMALAPNQNVYPQSGHEKSSPYHTNRPDKSTKERGGQRVRRLQLSDVDWYESPQDQKKAEQNGPNTRGSAVSDTCNEDKSALNRVDESDMNKRHTLSKKSQSRQASRRGRGKR